MTIDIQKSSWVAPSRPSVSLWYLIFVLPIVAAMAFAIFQPIQVLPRISLAPGYSFIDQDGNRFTNEDLRGSLVLYTFTHSRCAAPCVSTSTTLASLQPALAEIDTGDIPLQFVSISVDPDHDTPNVLRNYASSLGVDTGHWHFVTGDATQLKNVTGAGFRTYYGKNSQGNLTVDPVFALVDGWGVLRAVYRTATPDVEILKRDLRLVVQEIQNSTGVNRYAYEAAHLFLCYPK
jgi:protein SCO1